MTTSLICGSAALQDCSLCGGNASWYSGAGFTWIVHPRLVSQRTWMWRRGIKQAMLRSENLSLDEISVPFLGAVHLFHFHLLILLSLPASELRLVISRYLSTNAILIIKNLHSPFRNLQLDHHHPSQSKELPVSILYSGLRAYKFCWNWHTV